MSAYGPEGAGLAFGELIPDPDHPLNDFLEFAWLGGEAQGYVRNLARRCELLTPIGSTTFQLTTNGWGIDCTAASLGYRTVAAQPSAFAGGCTGVWQGVLIGAQGSSNSGILIGVNYGDGSGSPYSVFTIERPSSNADFLQVIRNDGAGSYSSSSTDVGLSSLYGLPITIAVSSVPAGAELECVIASPLGIHYNANLTNLPSAPATRNTSSTDEIWIGTNLGAGRFTNSIATGGALWSFGANRQQLLELAEDFGSVFTRERVRPSLAVSAPPPPPPAGSFWGGYRSIPRPAGNVGLRLRG